VKRYPKLVRILAVLALGLAASLSPSQLGRALAIDKPTIAKVLPAVVQLGPLVQVTQNGRTSLRYIPWGSGSIVSPKGYILTNHHVTDVSDLKDQARGQPNVKVIEGKLAVLLTKSQDEPPVATYIADVVADSTQLDLAVLHITQNLNGQAVNDSSLKLPFVELGDSDAVDIGDKIHIFGYPGIGGATITFTSGDVAGFSFERGITGRAWIKTSATIAGGNSGGTAVDDNGKLVGIPTQAGSGEEGTSPVDCRPVADTNGDGRIDNNDSCVPLGGFINALRPVNLAKQLIQQALGGVAPPTSTPKPRATTAPGGTTTPAGTTTPGANATATAGPSTGNAAVSRMVFSNGVTDNDQPVSIVTSLPSGSKSVIFFFDYRGFEDGTSWHPRLFLNGTEQPDVWPTSDWDGGPFGNWWVGFKNADLKDGTYKFQLDYNGKPLGTASITIGGSARRDPAFSDVTFSTGNKTGFVFPAGQTTINAQFQGSNVPTSTTTLQANWYNSDNGRWQQFSQSSVSWNGGQNGKGSVSLNASQPLEAGFYRLELLYNNRLATSGDFALTGAGPQLTPGVTPSPGAGGAAFGPITFATGEDSEGQPENPDTTFDSGISELHAFFDYQGMQDGMTWKAQWSLDGEVIIDEDQTWDSGESGTFDDYLTSRSGSMPDGEYEVKLFLEGEQVQDATAVVGSGGEGTATPTAVPDEDAVHISGTIVDADTGQPIADAVFVVLNEGVTWSSFQGTDEEVLDAVFTDEQGHFELSAPLIKGKSYSVGVGADGYQPIKQDNFEITNDMPSDLELDITLQQQ
jgi:S1-C subfamily serine protease